MRIAINGFGRIGRNFLRTILQDAKAREKIIIAVINIGPARYESVAHMFKYDTLMGSFNGSVVVENKELVINGYRIPLIAEKDPALINWAHYAVEWVVESSGHFTQRAAAQKHLVSGVHGVLISAPAHEADITIIMGINNHLFNEKSDRIVSLGSCTTNAIVPMLDVLDKKFGIESGAMTTVHAYTNTQVLLDVETSDLRRSRAAALNIIPTSTGSSDLIGTLLPQLKDKIVTTALRVPVAKVSLIDLTFWTRTQLSSAIINDAYLQAQSGYLKNIMAVTHEPLVSTDFYGNNSSVVIDSLMTHAHGNMGQVFGWYDNEWGYSERLKDFLFYCVV